MGGRRCSSACSLEVDAVVDCYGAFVVGEPPAGFPLKVRALDDRLADLRAPVLGLFGIEDKTPSPEHVAELDTRLEQLGKPHEFHTYVDAGHGFFAVDRPSYRVQAAVDGWERIADFFGRYL